MSKTNQATDKQITINFMDLDFKKIKFSELKTNKYGGKFVNINYDGKIPLVVFPKMTVPFGLTDFEDKKTGAHSYYLESSLDNKNENSELRPLYEKALKFDEFILKTVQKNHKIWLKDEDKPDLKYLKKVYTPLVKVPKDADKKELDYPSRIRANIYPSQKNNEFNFSCFNENKQKVSITTDNYSDIIGKGDSVSTVRRLKQIWFSNAGGFGATWDLLQARVFKSSNSLSKCLLMSEDEQSDDESETLEANETYIGSDNDNNNHVQNKEVISDEDFSDEE
jgi:hypothetical protein